MISKPTKHLTNFTRWIVNGHIIAAERNRQKFLQTLRESKDVNPVTPEGVPVSLNVVSCAHEESLIIQLERHLPKHSLRKPERNHSDIELQKKSS